MGFQDEMKQMFLRVAAGEVEPKEWETWWNGNKADLEVYLTRGDRGRMMPALWSPRYDWMAKTQSGVAYYFHAQGRPVKTSGYYEEKAKIAPLAKAYGMKKAGPKTFVREKNGLVSRIQFIGYFRGGGYEEMTCYFCPVYAIQYGTLGLPGHISQGEYFQQMKKDWGVIQYGTAAIDAAMVESINRKFDDILTFLADGVLPEWQKIDSPETYFAKERQDYLKAAAKGPKDPKNGRPMWDLDTEGKPDPWRADDYLFGVWDLLTGKEIEGYAHLEECVRHNSEYMETRLKEFPNACSDPRDAMAVMYRNAQLFLGTKEISDTQKRRDAFRETYEEVCRFMRYYHGLAKKTERS